MPGPGGWKAYGYGGIPDLSEAYVPQVGVYATTGTDVYESRVTGDAAARFVQNADGKMEWGDGTAAPDTNLYRSAADQLQTDDSLIVVSPAAGAIPLTLKAAPSQTGALLNAHDATDSVVAGIDSAGGMFAKYWQSDALVGAYLATFGASVQVIQRNPAEPALTVQGAASQTDNLQEWQDNAGPVLAAVTAAGKLAFGASGDTNLWRSGANTFASDSHITTTKSMVATEGLTTYSPIVLAGTGGAGTIVGTEQSSPPAAPSANGFTLYAEDNGSGKTRLMVLFASGAAQQIAIQP